MICSWIPFIQYGAESELCDSVRLWIMLHRQNWISRLRLNLNLVTQAGCGSCDSGWIWITWLSQNLNHVIWAECESLDSHRIWIMWLGNNQNHLTQDGSESCDSVRIWIMWLGQNLRYIFEYILNSTELQYHKIKQYDFYDTHGITFFTFVNFRIHIFTLVCPKLPQHCVPAHTLCPRTIFRIQQGHQSDNTSKKRIQFPLRDKMKSAERCRLAEDFHLTSNSLSNRIYYNL